MVAESSGQIPCAGRTCARKVRTSLCYVVEKNVLQEADRFRTLVGIVIGMSVETAAVVTVTATGAGKQAVPETATTEVDAVIQIVTATKNASLRGVVTVNAAVVTPEDAIGMSVAVKQQDIQRTAQQCQATEKARAEYTKDIVQFEHVATEHARIRSRSTKLPGRSWSTNLRAMLEALMTCITALEGDNARTRAESDELRKHMNTLQADASGGSSLVDTKPLPKPTESEEEDWTRFSMKMKAYFAAVDPKHDELLKIADGPERSLNHGDLGLEDDRRDGQSFFGLAMPLKDHAMNKVELADSTWGPQLWRKLTQENEQKWKSRDENCIRSNHVSEYMEMRQEEAEAAQRPRVGGPENLLVGEATTGDDEDANAGDAADKPVPLIQGAGAAGGTAPRPHPLWSSVFEANREQHADAHSMPRSAEHHRVGNTSSESGWHRRGSWFSDGRSDTDLGEH